MKMPFLKKISESICSNLEEKRIAAKQRIKKFIEEKDKHRREKDKILENPIMAYKFNKNKENEKTLYKYLDKKINQIIYKEFSFALRPENIDVLEDLKQSCFEFALKAINNYYLSTVDKFGKSERFDNLDFYITECIRKNINIEPKINCDNYVSLIIRNCVMQFRTMFFKNLRNNSLIFENIDTCYPVDLSSLEEEFISIKVKELSKNNSEIFVVVSEFLNLSFRDKNKYTIKKLLKLYNFSTKQINKGIKWLESNICFILSDLHLETSS